MHNMSTNFAKTLV